MTTRLDFIAACGGQLRDAIDFEARVLSAVNPLPAEIAAAYAAAYALDADDPASSLYWAWLIVQLRDDVVRGNASGVRGQSTARGGGGVGGGNASGVRGQSTAAPAIGPATPTAIVVDCTVRQARALALLVKRLTWTEIEANASDRDEAEIMRDALERLRRGLVNSGFDPR
jgi:hypothetical protein